jgi:DNA polymerase
VVKCRPPENRTPFQNEVDACKPYLMRELECIKPKLVIALGKTAMKALLGFDAPIKDVRGKVFKTKINEVQTKVIVTYHPAAVLRNPKLREEFKKDLVKAYNEVYKQRSLTEFK